MKIKCLLVALVAVFYLSSCSSSKKMATSSTQSSQAGPSSRNPDGGGATANSNKKGNKKAFGRTHADLVKEYENRMEDNAKRHKKEAKLAEKPQYSDPSYFGHKKKPKKRPVGKRKMCKECGIVH